MKLLIISALLVLGGCSILEQKPEIEFVEVPEIKYIEPPMPAPTQLEIPTIHVLTPSNSAAYFEENPEGAVFAFDAESYTILAKNIQEIRRYLLELQSIVKAYQKIVRTDSADEPK